MQIPIDTKDVGIRKRIRAMLNIRSKKTTRLQAGDSNRKSQKSRSLRPQGLASPDNYDGTDGDIGDVLESSEYSLPS